MGTVVPHSAVYQQGFKIKFICLNSCVVLARGSFTTKQSSDIMQIVAPEATIKTNNLELADRAFRLPFRSESSLIVANFLFL